MGDFTAELESLAGFELDLRDLGSNFSSNATRMLSGVVLPTNSSGLMATLASSFDKFQSGISAAQRTDLSAIDALGTSLATAATEYRASDDTSAKAMSAMSASAFGDSGNSTSGDRRGVNRFNALQLPSLPEVAENPRVLRKVVTSCISLISGYDDRFNEAIGIKPAADYLSPLVADWEALQAVGRRISLFGINDYVTSENLAGGSTWLQARWSGDASQAFRAGANAVRQSVAARGLDLDVVSKIVENGGACLERSVYNQALSLSAEILRPMSYLDGTFPLGIWAPYVNRTINETIRSEIASALDTLKKSAESRHNAMSMIVEKISHALDYIPGRSVPSFSATDFEIPDKVAVDFGIAKYGFGDALWWESTIDSVVSGWH